MQLLSLTLNGQYKGLNNQHFDFSQTQGNIIALIGLNGSGKSQLLELIAETFAYLERWQREDFKTKARRGLGFGISIVYQCDIHKHQSMLSYHDTLVDADNFFAIKVDIQYNGDVLLSVKGEDGWKMLPGEKVFPVPIIIGYSSGLNENLQRSFMKNAVQYFEVMRIRKNRRKELSAKLDGDQIAEINQRYQAKHPHIFQLPSDNDRGEQLLDLEESDTALSQLIYLDYDNVGLLLTSLAVLPHDEIAGLLDEITFKYPTKVTLQYNLRGHVAGEDAIRDIQLLSRIAGPENTTGIGQRTTDDQYDLYGLDYLEGAITLDLADSNVAATLSEANYGDPVALFRRLFKIQQLGVNKWQHSSRLQLQKDNFIGTVKKPLKAKLPLSVSELKLSDGVNREVNFDDLSDGEAQLLQVLAASRIFSREDALFLLDEPETHLNPSWRTHFHRLMNKALSQQDEYGSKQALAFVSTHSPFMISSLKQEDVYFFSRDENRTISMERVDSQTYGASFEVLIKKYFGLRSLISQTVVEAVKEHLPTDEQPESRAKSRQWVEDGLGDSMEKAYLLRKLQD